MTENEAHCRVVFLEGGEYVLERSVNICPKLYLAELIDHNLAPGANIIHPNFDRVSSCLANAMSYKSRIESHVHLMD